MWTRITPNTGTFHVVIFTIRNVPVVTLSQQTTKDFLMNQIL